MPFISSLFFVNLHRGGNGCLIFSSHSESWVGSDATSAQRSHLMPERRYSAGVGTELPLTPT